MKGECLIKHIVILKSAQRLKSGGTHWIELGNTIMESFFATLKAEWVDRHYVTRAEGRSAIFDYMLVQLMSSPFVTGLSQPGCF